MTWTHLRRALTCAVLAAATSWPASPVGAQNDRLLPYSWFDGAAPRRMWLARDEVGIVLRDARPATAVAAVARARTILPRATIEKGQEGVLRVLRLPRGEDARAYIPALRREWTVRYAGAIYYNGDIRPEARLMATGEIIVAFQAAPDGDVLRHLSAAYDLRLLRAVPGMPHAFLFDAQHPDPLALANALGALDQVRFAQPNWVRPLAARSDPLQTAQWHLQNTGQGGGSPGVDVNVGPAWPSGMGSPQEVIAVVDDGVQIGHEDLAPNVVAGLSYNYVNGTTDPTPGSPVDAHGTAVAGVAAARGSNGLGGAGVAPLAGLAGFNYLENPTSANEADVLTRSAQTIDIYSNSWGPLDGGNTLQPAWFTTQQALVTGVNTGRQGRGSIYVFAAGNGGPNDNANYDGYANARQVIAVGATTNQGLVPGYAEPGANILVSAPSDGGTLGVTTTDLTGTAGYSPNSYTNTFGGTSAAAPAVAGIAALMLQAKPTLGWRDVRAILALSARKNEPTSSGWALNGAGLPVHHHYGFGRVDAAAAVGLARTWTNLGPEVSVATTAWSGLPIPDAPATGTPGAPASSTIQIADDFVVEFVEVVFSARDHTYWADLRVELTSPAGTTSVLAETHSAGSEGPLLTRYDSWRFGSARHFAERAAGAWTLRVVDGQPQDTGTFEQWTLRLYGSRNGLPAALLTSVTGNGSVRSVPGGISCGTTCRATFAPGTTVTLVPEALPGATFAGWAGDADCSDARVVVQQTVSCTATFQTAAPTALLNAIDLNGNGTADVFFHNPTSGLFKSALSSGTGSFGVRTGYWAAGTWQIVPARLNADNRTDFFLYDLNTGQWWQALSLPDGDFAYTTSSFQPEWQTARGRFDGDSLDDIILYNSRTGMMALCFTDGLGGFKGFRFFNWQGGHTMYPARLNNDGLTDVFLYNPSTGAWARAESSGSDFTYSFGNWAPGYQVTIADLSGDGLDDVFVYNPLTGLGYQCLNSAGQFVYYLLQWAAGFTVARGRLDANATDDLFLFNPETGLWYQCFSNGAGSFQYVGAYWSPGWTVAVLPLNSDALDDVFIYTKATGEWIQVMTAPGGGFSAAYWGAVEPGFSVISAR